MRWGGGLVASSEATRALDDADGGTELLDGRGVDADLWGDALVGQFHGQSVVVLLGQTVVSDDLLDLPQTRQTDRSAQRGDSKHRVHTLVVNFTICNDVMNVIRNIKDKRERNRINWTLYNEAKPENIVKFWNNGPVVII